MNFRRARALALVRQMPGALASLRVTDLHIGDDPLRALANALTKAFGNDDMGDAPGKAAEKL